MAPQRGHFFRLSITSATESCGVPTLFIRGETPSNRVCFLSLLQAKKRPDTGYPRKKPSTASQRPENSAELIVLTDVPVYLFWRKGHGALNAAQMEAASSASLTLMSGCFVYHAAVANAVHR